MFEKFKGMFAFLELVFPPISNQEFYDFGHQSIKDYLYKSDFYMIAAKPKLEFRDIIIGNGTISFKLYEGNNLKSFGSINLSDLDFLKRYQDKPYKISKSKNHNAITFFLEEKGSKKIIERFTPENILWHKSRKCNGIFGLDNYKELLCYDLLYVGISKDRNAYERLSSGHKARTNILSNENQRLEGARISDETFLFFFKMDSIYLQNMSFRDDNLEIDHDAKKILVDAEKAFINLLQPHYNAIKYKNYPKSKDGLFSSDLDRYIYSIREDITFNTPNGKIKGAVEVSEFMSNEADFIFVTKELAEIVSFD